MSGVGAAIGTAVAGVAGAVIQGNAAKSAAKTQANAQEQAIQAQQQMFQQIQQNEQPYMQAGNTAVNQLSQLTSGNMSAKQILSMSPNYAFQQQMGKQGVLNTAASGQGALAGATQAALMSYNQGLASNAYQQAFGDLYSLANLGQNAASNTGAQGVQLTGQTSQALTNIGNAQAQGILGQASAATGGLNSLASAGTLYSLGNMLNPNTTSNLGLNDAGSLGLAGLNDLPAVEEIQPSINWTGVGSAFGGQS